MYIHQQFPRTEKESNKNRPSGDTNYTNALAMVGTLNIHIKFTNRELVDGDNSHRWVMVTKLPYKQPFVGIPENTRLVLKDEQDKNIQCCTSAGTIHNASKGCMHIPIIMLQWHQNISLKNFTKYKKGWRLDAGCSPVIQTQSGWSWMMWLGRWRARYDHEGCVSSWVQLAPSV